MARADLINLKKGCAQKQDIVIYRTCKNEKRAMLLERRTIVRGQTWDHLRKGR